MKQATRGEGVAHAPEQITSRRRGRPAGSTKADPKERINIRLSPDVLQHFKAQGQGWQTRIDVALRQFMAHRRGGCVEAVGRCKKARAGRAGGLGKFGELNAWLVAWSYGALARGVLIFFHHGRSFTTANQWLR